MMFFLSNKKAKLFTGFAFFLACCFGAVKQQVFNHISTVGKFYRSF
jgi:hypothetical protein